MYKILRACRHWYNMCLEDRKLAYELEGRHVTRNDQNKKSASFRKAFRLQDTVFSQTLQVTCDDLDKAFKAFFRRIKGGEAPGYPRFKGAQHFHSFGFPRFGVGVKLDGRRLKLFGIGRVAVRWHREMSGKAKTARISVKAGKWYVSFSCEQDDPIPLPKTDEIVGLDMGVSALLTSDKGEQVDNPKWYRKSQKDLRVAQRSLQRKKKGGKNRRKALITVQRLHEHVSNTRKDFLNKIVYSLVQNYDLIAIEDLRIKNMVRNRHLSKSILDAGWGYFRERLVSKAANAGREVVVVNPAYTSKTCSNCGEQFVDFSLSVRWVECAHCGLSLNRDHNAAINILKRAIGQDVSVGVNVDRLGHA